MSNEVIIPERILIGVDRLSGDSIFTSSGSADTALTEGAESPGGVEVPSWLFGTLFPEAKLTLMHVIDLPALPSFISGGMESQDAIAEALIAHASSRLEEFAAELGNGDVRVAQGSPAETMVQTAQASGAGLIVVGRHGDRPLRKRILGSTAERILARSEIPVLITSPGAPGKAARDQPVTILAAVDGSTVGRQVLAWSRMLADRLHAELTVLHVIDPKIYGRARIISSPGKREELMEEALADAERWLEKTLEEEGFNLGEVRVRTVVGRPAREILTAEEELDADLLVFGSRGEGAVAQFILGSVARTVLHESYCPMFVVT